jgi:hypothetical protein
MRMNKRVLYCIVVSLHLILSLRLYFVSPGGRRCAQRASDGRPRAELGTRGRPGEG